MTTKRKSQQTARATLLVGLLCIALVIVILYSVKEVHYYSKDPVGPKDCPPINPELHATQPTISMEEQSQFDWQIRGGYINDASCLNKTPIYGIINIHSEADIQKAFLFAKKHSLKITPAGVKHSMGGQAFTQYGLILNMKEFKQIALNEEKKTITVQSGATWHDIQSIIHPKYAIKSMQSTDIFTVGGSVSVNAHGMDHTVGSIAETIKSLRILNPKGEIETVSRETNSEYFRHIVGGYGLFGIIVDAELEITDNVMYDYKETLIPYTQFPDYFRQTIQANPAVQLMYGHLSTAPNSLLKEMIIYSYTKTDEYKGEIPPLTEVSSVAFRRFVLNLSKMGTLPMNLKWWAEKHIEPKLTSCHVNRNQGLSDGESCFVSRNEPMHDSVKYLQNDFKEQTDILQEYYIPRSQFIPYIDNLREIFIKQQANVLNVSIRVVHKEDIALNYAPEDMFAVVLYINQSTDLQGNEKMRVLTQSLIDLTTKAGGRFFLPYQLHYTSEQLTKAYPEILEFFRTKKQYDPEEIFTNTFYEKYKDTI